MIFRGFIRPMKHQKSATTTKKNCKIRAMSVTINRACEDNVKANTCTEKLCGCSTFEECQNGVLKQKDRLVPLHNISLLTSFCFFQFSHFLPAFHNFPIHSRLFLLYFFETKTAIIFKKLLLFQYIDLNIKIVCKSII